MRMHWLAGLAVVVMALSPMIGRANQAPHDKSFTDGDCANCHTLFDSTALGGSDYSGGCNACHANQSTSTLKLPAADLEAKPGVRGTHHSWSGFAENPAAGAITPPVVSFAARLADGRLQCIVCHDLHNANPDASPGSRHTSIPVGVAQLPLAGSTGTARMTLVNPGTAARGYRLRLQSATSFIITKTARATGGPTWLNWNAGTSSWVVGTVAGPGKPFALNTPVAVEEPTGVTVQWGAGGQAGDTWEFFVSYPGLRLTMQTDYMCTFCHQPMVMSSKRVGGGDMGYAVDGVRTFSHPVGEALGSNGLDSDHPAILDANGAQQSAGDGVATNDLKLDGTVVRCTTCHAVHGADSNSLTDDVR